MIKASLASIRNFKDFNDYLVQFMVLNGLSTFFGEPLRDRNLGKKYSIDLLKGVFEALKWDHQNMASGAYPPEITPRKSLIKKSSGFLEILKDYPKVLKARKKNKTLVKREDFPDYYQRAFHFQTEGYLSDTSAQIYEQQVDILFTGLTDIMRRCFFPFLVRQFTKPPERVLEMACGTGRGTEMLKVIFPESDYTLNDLSPHYINHAKKKESLRDCHFVQGEAQSLLTLQESSFDLTFHIYLFHELPAKERRSVLKEQLRLTRKGGLIIIADSLQVKDRPDLKEILEDFPKKYHEPYYKNYLYDDLEEELEAMGAKIVHKEKVLLTKCLIAKKVV